jgi:hypothetical protein
MQGLHIESHATNACIPQLGPWVHPPCRVPNAASQWLLPQAQVRLVFGLNAMTFRANETTRLNMHNIDAFIAYTAANKLPVFGFELGNELPKIPPQVVRDPSLTTSHLRYLRYHQR